MRERGLDEEAERVRAGELMPLVMSLRTAGDTDALITERLNSVFAVEADRVANAAALAEVLLPMITEQLRPLVPSPATAPTAAAGSSPGSSAAAPPKPAPPRPASIADFIDDMIAQERPPDRPGHGAQRRAS